MTIVVATVEFRSWNSNWDDHYVYDNYLSENECTPTFCNAREPFNYVRFALKTNDLCYGGEEPPYDYRYEIPGELLGRDTLKRGDPGAMPLVEPAP